MVDEDVALADRGEHVDRLVVLALQPRLGAGAPGLVAELGPARDVGDVAEVGEVDQAVDVVDLAGLEPQRIDQLAAELGVHPGRDLEPDDLAEAAAAEFVLDRLEEVVGLVGDGEVGVAGDPEVAVVDDLGAGEERVEVGGDRLLERDEGLAPVLADPQEATEQLLRHLDPGDDLGRALGVAQQDPEAEREVRDVGERPAEADHQRRQRREDLVVEAGVDLARAPRSVAVSSETIRIPSSSSAGRSVPSKQRLRRPSSSRTRAWIDVDLFARAEAVGAAGVDPGLELVEQPGDPDHEELVEVRGVDRAEADPLEQRHLRVLGQLQHPLVEVEPGELAVEVERWIVDQAIVLPPLRPPARLSVRGCAPAPPRCRGSPRPARGRGSHGRAARAGRRSRARQRGDPLDPGQHHVAVVDVAEHALQLLGRPRAATASSPKQAR